MDETTRWKAAVDDLKKRLQEETKQRAELERRCHLLEKLAHRDPATGLRTESYLRTRVQEELQRSIRYPAATTLVTVCAPGEQRDVMPSLGQRLSQELRASDHVFRLSDSSLAVLLVETGEEGARQVLDRLSADLEQVIAGYGCSVTSFPTDTNLADDFLRLAMERHNQVQERVLHSNGGNHNTGASVH